MLFRFGSAIALVVLVSLAGTTLEKHNLELRRKISTQRYRAEALQQWHSSLRSQAQRLGAPARVIDAVEAARSNGEPSPR